jgi:hypothetical protein
MGQVYSISASKSLMFIRRMNEFKNAFWCMMLPLFKQLVHQRVEFHTAFF